MNEINWDKYNAAEADGISKGSTEDVLSCDIDIAIEITAVDRTMVEESFTGTHIAGDEVVYRFNSYKQLGCTVGGFKAKGGLLKGILKAIATDRRYFIPVEEIGLNNQWTITRGIMFPNGSRLEVGLLSRGDVIIGIFKKGANVGNTIKWYEKMIYKTGAWKAMKTHSLRDFKPEFHAEDDIYADQAPEFTREPELEEIAQFISSLRGRRLSAGEQILLGDIKAELDSMV